MDRFSRRSVSALFAAAPLALLVARQARAATTHEVSIMDFAFSPAQLTIKPGDTVRWTNTDSAPHTATATNGTFDTGTLSKGKSKETAFAEVGKYGYRCNFHPSMTATITVKA